MENIGHAVERLLMDESLTADVDDAAAKALLRWGEEQVKAGRPEETVRQGLRALGKVISRRAALDPAAARARLEQAGLAAADETTLASLWAEKLTEGEWAQRLLQALTLPTGPRSLVAPSPCRPPSGEDEETQRQGDKRSWWRRLFSRREPR